MKTTAGTSALPKREWVFVNGGFGMGGAERAFIEIIRHLDQHVSDIHLTCASYTAEGPLRAELPGHVDLRILNSAPSIVLRNIRRVSSLVSLLREKRPEIVVSFINYVNVLTLFCSWFAPNSRFVAVEQCTLSINDLTGEVKPMPFWRRLFLKWLYRRAWRVITISTGIKQEMVSVLDIDPDRIVVIHNPIPYERIRQDSGDIRETDFSFAFLGRLVPQKNIELLLKAFAGLKRMLPEAQFRLHVIGEGRLRAELQQKSIDLGVADRITWHGLLPEPWKALSRCHCLVLSSNFEGFANVLAEALALGLPVISTDCPYGPRDIIGEHPEAGLLVKPQNAQAFSEAMASIYANRDEINQHTGERTTYAQRFASQRISGQYAALLTS
jgi:glycosyltransferase involved in cell wall biosynthesis